MPSGRVSPLHMPKLIGRLNQVHYVPVYDVTKEKKKRKRGSEAEWINYLEQAYMQNKQSQEGTSPDALSTYVGMRQPLQMKMVEAKYASPGLQDLNRPNSTPNATADHLHQAMEIPKQLGSKKEQQKARANRRRERLAKIMAVDTTVGHKTPNSTLHLPQIMKSFLPTISRKGQQKSSTKSSWTDLTSQAKVRQVAPSDYKSSAMGDPQQSRVTFFTVNYDSKPPPKLQRRPLPPLHDGPLNSSFQQPTNPTVWLPSESQAAKGHSNIKLKLERREDSKPATQAQDAKTRAMETLLEKLDKARQLNFPNDSFKRTISSSKQGDFWESSTKPKPLRSRHRKKRDSDRHFGNHKSGIVLNKLPADLMGNFQSNFQNLEYYLGRVNEPNKSVTNQRTVHIPTGRTGEGRLTEDEEDEDLTNHYFMRRLRQGKNDVKIRYAHRDSNDTPPLDQLPWEEPKEPKVIANPPSVSVIKSSNSHFPTALKAVKRVTINMPKVPPPSPETTMGRPKSRGKRRKANQQNGEKCQYCDDTTTKNVWFRNDGGAEVAATLPTVLEHARGEQEAVCVHFKKFDGRIQNDMTVKPTPQTSQKSQNPQPEKFEPQNKLTEKLIAAHGALKRRHKCPKREVVIAPFKVSIDDEERLLEAKFDAAKLQEKKLITSTVTKPFTFSYMPSKEKKEKKKDSNKKNVSKSAEKKTRSIPTIFNNKSQKHFSSSDVTKPKSSYISSYVAVNQSKEIYDALIADRQSVSDNTTNISLDKATDCEGIDIPTTPPHNRKVKGHDQVKDQLSSHNASITVSTEQLIAV